MLRYAIITPSYAGDRERCRLLVESVRRHAAPGIEHHLVVDRRDERLFAPLAGPHTHVCVTEDVLPRWLHQVPFWPKWWVSLKGRPSRGWIVQQLVKLSVDAITSADVCVFLDSDCFLVRPYDPSAAERGGAVPLFAEDLPLWVAFNAGWHARAAALLGLSPEPGCRRNYVGNAVIWRRANVIALHHRLEQVSGRGWVEALASLPTLSEYTLYGTFCERVLGDASGHYPEATINMLSYWREAPLGDAALLGLRDALRPEHVGVMISSKSRTRVPAIRRAFGVEAVAA